MKQAMSKRLQELQAEYQAGQKMLADLDARRAELTSTMLRIEGAIQVLKELSGSPTVDDPIAPGSANGASLHSDAVT